MNLLSRLRLGPIVVPSFFTVDEEPSTDMAPEKLEEGNAMDALMTAYQGGGWEAFERLYQLLKDPLFQFLRSRVGDHSRAEDLLQQTFLQIHRSRRSYLPGRSARAWAFGIAKNVLLMDERRRFRKTARELPLEGAQPGRSSPPSEQIAHRDLLEKALRVLSDDQAEAFLLHEVHGFTFPEIGGILGIRTATAKVRAFRAGRAIQAELQRLGVTTEGVSTKKSM